MGVQQGLGVDGGTPRRFHADDLGAAAGRHVAHALSKHAVDAYHHGVTGAQDVYERGLHASRTGRRHREGQRVVRPEDLAEPVVGLVQNGDEVGVEVAEDRTSKGLNDLWVGVARTGTHEDAVCVRHAGHPTANTTTLGKVLPCGETSSLLPLRTAVRPPGRPGCRTPRRGTRRSPAGA